MGIARNYSKSSESNPLASPRPGGDSPEPLLFRQKRQIDCPIRAAAVHSHRTLISHMKVKAQPNPELRFDCPNCRMPLIARLAIDGFIRQVKTAACPACGKDGLVNAEDADIYARCALCGFVEYEIPLPPESPLTADESELLTIPAAAARIGCSKMTIYNAIRRGKINHLSAMDVQGNRYTIAIAAADADVFGAELDRAQQERARRWWQRQKQDGKDGNNGGE